MYTRRKSVESMGPPTGEQYGACLSIGISFAIGMQAKKIESTPSKKEIQPSSFTTRDQWELKTTEHEAIGVLACEFEAYAQSVFQDLRNNAFGISEEESANLQKMTYRILCKVVKNHRTCLFIKNCLGGEHHFDRFYAGLKPPERSE